MEDVSLTQWGIWGTWASSVLAVCWSGDRGPVEGGPELCTEAVVGWWVLVGLEALGCFGGAVLLLPGEGEEGGGCSWLTGVWSPTCWTSCLLGEEEELLGARTWRCSSRGSEGWGGPRTNAAFPQFLWWRVYLNL